MSMKRRKRRGRRVDETGRNIGDAQHVRLYHWLLRTPAWRSLTAQSRAVYIEIAQRFNGSNNGEIALSVRQAAERVSIAKDTASKCFRELEAKGFIRRNVCGSFNWKARHATTWILTAYEEGQEAASKDFIHWVPENSEPGPTSRTRCPKRGLKNGRFRSIQHISVPHLGPWVLSCTVPRSQSATRL
jgi:hypothetical protein